MNLPFFIAKRYILGKKSHSAINLVSAISMAGVIVGTISFILILSVFNGFDKLAKSMYNSFYPDLEIVPIEGKVFHISEDTLALLNKIEGVEVVAEVLTDNALLYYRNKQTICKIKGVSSNYNKINDIESMITYGEYALFFDSMPRIILGREIAGRLGVNINLADLLKIYVPKRTAKISQNPEKSLNTKRTQVSGVYMSQPDIERIFAIAPLNFTRELFEYPNQVSSLELKISENIRENSIIVNIQKLLGNNLLVKTRYQQNEVLYKTMRTEKWAIFLILALVLIILLFSLIGSISMLIIEKKKDIVILHSLGADQGLIRKIFLREGILITFAGAITGLSIGALAAWLQEKFGFVKLGDNYIIDAYPVDIQGFDLLIVITTVFIMGAISTWYPVNFLITKNLDRIS